MLPDLFGIKYEVVSIMGRSKDKRCCRGFTLISLLLADARRSCKLNAKAFTLIGLPCLRQRSCQGFTLIELLVVIAIVAVLAAVVVIVLNPLELTRRSRDATRLADLEGLQKALNITLQDATGADILCNGAPPCSGLSHVGTREIDGTGWIPVDLTQQTTVQVPTLPIDPSNNATYHYSYSSDGTDYELNAVLESDQQRAKMETDGGDNTAVYESGTDLTIIN